jgi:hypothetical protein
MLQSMFRFGLMLGIGLATAGRLAAQAMPYRGGIGATSVQLPTFNFFSVSTSVEVPDSGEAFLGGNSSSSTGSSQRGIPGLGFRPFSNSAIGSAGHGGSMSVRATIHDFDAMDKALLGKDFYNTIAKSASGDARPATDVVAADSAGSSSLADIRRQQSAEDAAAAQEVQAIIDQGRAYEAAGKPGLAKIQYRMAAHRATGALQQQALAELQRLNASSQPASASQSPPR